MVNFQYKVFFAFLNKELPAFLLNAELAYLLYFIEPIHSFLSIQPYYYLCAK